MGMDRQQQSPWIEMYSKHWLNCRLLINFVYLYQFQAMYVALQAAISATPRVFCLWAPVPNLFGPTHDAKSDGSCMQTTRLVL